MSRLGSKSEYAEHIGASPAYVSKLAKQGRLVVRVDDDGKEKVDFDLTDRLVRNTTDLGRSRNGENAKPGRAPSTPIAPPPSGASSSTRMDLMFRQAQVQEKVYTAKREELAYKKEIGELVDAKAVSMAIWTAFRTLRDTAMPLGRKVARKVSAMTDEREIQALIDEEMRVVLQSFRSKVLEPVVLDHVGVRQDGGADSG